MHEEDVEPNKKYREKLDKTKKVVKKHWKPFTIGVGVTLVIVATVIVARRVISRNMLIEEVSIDFFNKPTRNLVEVMVPETNVGNDIFNPGTRVGFFSQRSVGRAYGVSEPMVTNHLQGDLPHIQGDILERTNFRIFAEVE